MISKLKKVKIDGHFWWVRPDTMDEYIIKEARGYLKRVQLDEQDNWLDAGANIGAFACRIAKHVSTVIAVEPAPDNLVVLAANLQIHKANNVRIIPKALVGDEARYVSLYLNQARNPGSHSQFVQRGRPFIRVSAREINGVIEQYSINKIKMDVEGAEVGILTGISDMSWGQIQELVYEYHFSALKDRSHKTYLRLRKMLTRHNFVYEGMGPDEGMKNWHTIAYAYRLR